MIFAEKIPVYSCVMSELINIKFTNIIMQLNCITILTDHIT